VHVERGAPDLVKELSIAAQGLDRERIGMQLPLEARHRTVQGHLTQGSGHAGSPQYGGSQGDWEVVVAGASVMPVDALAAYGVGGGGGEVK
jgi:hypothetical protein